VFTAPGRAGRHVTRRWRELDRDRKVALAGMTVLVAGAIAVRAWLMFGYRSVFLGFPDSNQYLFAASRVRTVFVNTQKPAGYPIFLEIVRRLISDRVSFTILMQHVVGIATGVLLYKSVKRTGAPPYLGLLPAAIVFFGGTGVLIEHSLLADSLFAFVQAVGVYAAVRALSEPELRWPLLAGFAIGASFWLKTVGLASALLVPPLLLVAAPGTSRRRALSAATAAAVALALIIGYVPIQAAFTGRWGYQSQEAWNLYGRVATFVNCSRFTPPRGTRFLCPAELVGRRRSQDFDLFAPTAPAVRRFGGPLDAPASANAVLERFSVAAIEHEPLAYARAIVRSMGFYVSPRPGEEYTPASLREELLNPEEVKKIQPALSRYYPGARGYTGGAAARHSLDVYESHTRVQGPFLILLLLAGIIGAPLLTGRARWGAILFTLTAIFSATFAVAGSGYNARYAYVCFGPLAAGAALGAWGIATRLMQEAQRRRSSYAPPDPT